MGALGTTKWDQARGRELYDLSWTLVDIAKELGINVSTVHHFAARHWPARDKFEVGRINRSPRVKGAVKDSIPHV